MKSNIKTYEYDGVCFSVSPEGKLIKMTNVSGEAVDIFIPSILPNYVSIKSLSSEFVEGRFKTIKISSFINDILPRAFARAEVEKIIWSSNCDVIQNSCFDKCSARIIENIEHVSEVERYGFAKSNFEEVVWPSSCNTIPEKCFQDAAVRTIKNLQDVTEIGFGAFMGSHIESIVWPACCNTISEFCFAGSAIKDITGMENIAEIKFGAFMQASDLNFLDLSESFCLNRIGENAFSGLSRDMVTLPYYSDIELDENFHFKQMMFCRDVNSGAF